MLAPQGGPWTPSRGFQRQEYGLDWYPSKEALYQACPGPVFVGTAYEYWAPSKPLKPRQARKYAAFQSHEEFWESISDHNRRGRPQNLHEVLPADRPRCLYFDVDGSPEHSKLHNQIMAWLRHYVRWFFGGDHLGWSPTDPDPVVLRSSDPTKYSCHVVFPQIQLTDYAQQREYLGVLLNGLPALVVDLEDGESVPILQQLVDRVPYTQFQLFRGPFACKLSAGQLRPETMLEPEGYFRSDPLTCFAGYVYPDYALALPPVQQLLDWNEELRHLNKQQQQRVHAATREEPRAVSPLDVANLYQAAFQQHSGGGTVDFAGMTDLEKYEEALRWLHPERASQWWSWFRISGVTCKMLQRYRDNQPACERIWSAHFAWSRSYPDFDQGENVDMVRAGRNRPTSGIQLLLNLVRFDNPDMTVRTSIWQQSLRGAQAPLARDSSRSSIAGCPTC